MERDGGEWVVWFINDSRAAIAPLSSVIKWRAREADGKLQFMAKGETENISPNSEVEVLRSLGRKGLVDFLESNKNADNQKTSMSKDKSNNKSETKSKSKKDKTPSAGKLGGYKGHSITSVVRAFGKAGWTLDEARVFFTRNDIEVADTTIKIQLRAGVKGEGGDPADFSKDELSKMKPKVAAKTEKSGGKSKDKKKGKGKPAAEEKDDTKEEDEEEVKEPAEADAE